VSGRNLSEGEKRSSKRVKRDMSDLLDSLRRHVKLLREYYRQVFEEDDRDYVGDLVGKLRLLVHEGGRNTPLLLSLMDHLGVDIPITLGGPPIKCPPGHPEAGDKISLRRFLSLTAYGIQTPTKGYVELSKKDLIRIWSQQAGAAHEDWELDEELASAREMGLFIGGLPALLVELKLTCAAVLFVSETFLRWTSTKAIKDLDNLFSRE